ncbi:GTP pyrophosphokinase [Desulfonispora thiosulfatigenes DSM 11270]|uniref:GTP diphosphokinase n=1 Tax=Desulfonispora thiosulfatigenes DSM 11270 TaxID=656914 RepID=A0A1W1VQP2_DESTI|nr:bifunctional (p)ppGpp synthetase/guanosine-3',5'-bis(diphosphate) 3'-pyrophosphohydrolase [Desulfonispora thiosulfatigenes]SMB95685.1 GTP pyrophosphokinase [Desulfonispora thiosulfatigenes DSM 11270]
MPIQELLTQVLQNNSKADVELIKRAYNYAKDAHEGQLRNSGEPYITHPLAIAHILASLGLDAATIAAGLLHDVVEDTDIDIKEIENKFGDEIALLVDGVTKLSRIEYKSKELRQIESYRKMFLAMSKDIRVMLIKLADRLHNMRTLKHQSFWKQREIAKETLEIFSPLASRLGIFKIKWELDDLSLRYLEPEKYYYLVEQISMKRKEREEFINRVIETLNDEITNKANIEADISGRPKHFYSIYVKMEKKGKDLNEIYDLIAIRIIVNSVKDCYGTLGIIHTLWKPIPGRFKDYIAMPKPNLYQSLHTSVIGPKGNPLEIQIRTWDMHRTAEYGIAAHWLYKEASKQKTQVGDQLTWLKQIKELQNELQDPKEFMETLKLDLFTDLVFIFSPKGDVYELPAGSTPIDFAYRVHTEIGHSCIGSKVNSRIVPLDYELKTGDIVEVLTTKQANGPSRDWIKMVKSSQAKNKIRQWFKREKREVNYIRGKETLEKELRKQGLDENTLTKPDKLSNIAKKLGFNNNEDLLVAIGDGAVTSAQVILKLKDEYGKETKIIDTNELLVVKQPQKLSSNQNSQGVRIKGIDNVLVRFSRCCNPLPGDKIIGFITRGRGVSIHREDCPNVKVYKIEEPERLLEAAWDEVKKSNFQVEIKIVALDRLRLTSEVMLIIGDSRTHINGINARVKRGYAYIDVKVSVNNLEELNILIEKIRRVKDVVEVQRITPAPAKS